MRVTSVAMRNFMGIEEAAIRLPETGLVAVTGVNGEGKSAALIESVSACYWNKTLRGTPWWRKDGTEGEVVVKAGDIAAKRVRKGGKTALSIADGPNYDTATKAGDYLIANGVPTQDLWRKTSVFTSAQVEGLTFSKLTDADRKRLIEKLLGLDRFDPALTKCRAALKQEEGKRAEAERVHKEAVYKADAEQARAEDARKSRTAIDAPGERPPKGEAKALADQTDALRRDLDGLRTNQARGGQQLAVLEVKIGGLEREAKRLGVDECPVCGQIIPEVLAERCLATLADAQAEADKMRAEAEVLRENEFAQIAELQEQHDFLGSQAAEAAAAIRAYERSRSERDRLENVIQRAATASVRHMSDRVAARQGLDSHGAEVEVLRAAERVLGLKGVRAHMLGGLLGGIEQIANGWLTPLGMSVGLKPFRVLANKNVEDAIDLTVEGAGGGFGYDACSNGERRRVDLFILLAIASVSQAAHGASAGTLYFDEAFDGLDKEGQAAVAAALADIARDRCVVLISHSDTLLAAVDAELRLHVEGGGVFEL